MKIAGVQMDVTLMDIDRNIDRIIDRFRESCAAGAELTVFPECAVTGYCFDDVEEAMPFAQTIPGPATDRLADVCRDVGGSMVVGMLELDGSTGVFNVAVCIGPAGVIGTYRKVHLPYLGIDRFSTYGDRPFAVHAAGDLRVGMNICYDAAFPEASRALALQHADLIALPTNWPPGAECVAESCINTRAMENGVFYMAVNRVGIERGVRFIGRSRICNPSGETLIAATGTDEDILYAHVNVEEARRKRIIRVPRVHAIDRFADRRPEMYGELIKPHSLPHPGRDVDV